jgi:hypothetical protein
LAGVSGSGGGSSDSGATQGGASQTGGNAGSSSGSPSGGTAGTAGGAALADVAKAFDGLRLECPCIDPNHFGQEKSDNCDSAPEVDRQTLTRPVGGNSNVVYDVTLRVRGNTEPNTFKNGTLQGERFYTGGETSTPGYTAYMLTVSDPQQVYFFNYNPSTGHIHFLIDYQAVIPMRGGATLKFEVNGGKSLPDGHGVSNREQLVVPDVAPAPAPFNGQLVQFDVTSVVARPGL